VGEEHPPHNIEGKITTTQQHLKKSYSVVRRVIYLADINKNYDSKLSPI
jgi:hypothetical protein